MNPNSEKGLDFLFNDVFEGENNITVSRRSRYGFP